MADTPQSRAILIAESPDNTSGDWTNQYQRNLMLSVQFQQQTVVAAATTTTLPTCTYANGLAGVGATLTATATGVVTLDGQTVALGKLYFIKNQAATEQNGVYISTVAGAVGVANVFTRADNWCYPGDFVGTFVGVGGGSTLSGTAWFCNPSGAVTVGTTGLPFVQVGAGGGPPSGSASGDLSGTYPGPTVAKIGGNAIVIGGAFTMSGAHTFVGTITGNTTVTYPTTGTLATLGNSLSDFAAPSADLSIGTHKLTNVVDPASAQDAATKNYVDTQVANIVSKADCAAATTVALAAATYNNGSSGVGATLTLTVAAVLVLDGYTPVLNDRLLIKNQASAFQNGIYQISTLGTVLINAVLTRTTDMNLPAQVDGALTAIVNGATNGGTRWQCLVSGTVVFGTTNLVWSAFTGSTYTGDGSTITITGTTVAIAAGYTGQSSIVTVGALATGSLAAGFTAVTVPLGGTGLATATAHGIILGEGTSAFAVTAAMTNGQLLVGQTGADPLPKTVSGDVTVAASGAVTVTGITGTPFPTDYASRQNWLSWTSTTSITVGTGSIYNPIDSKVETIASPIVSSPSITTSTQYYVYLATGGATVVVSTTAPTAYQGNAKQDSSNRRYLGSFLTDASSHIINFTKSGNRTYFNTASGSSPFAVLAAGVQSASAASVSCSGCIPATSNTAIVNLLQTSAISVYIGNSNQVPSSGNAIIQINGASVVIAVVADVPLVSQAFQYRYASTATGGLYANVYGFMEDV